MARRVRVSTWYARTAGPTLKHGTPRADSVGRTARALAAADALPGPTDYEAKGHDVAYAYELARPNSAQPRQVTYLTAPTREALAGYVERAQKEVGPPPAGVRIVLEHVFIEPRSAVQ